MSKGWRVRLIVYGILALVFGGVSWWLLEDAKKRDPDRKVDVVFRTTPPESVDKMLEVAGVTEDDVVYDLGCGDARILIAAAKKYGCKCVGWELDPKLVDQSRRNVEAAGVARLVEIHHGDIFDADISGCTVLAIYLLPDLNVRLIPQINKMKPGSRIVSYLADMPGVPPKQTVKFVGERNQDQTIYLWTAPIEKP